MFHYCLRKEAYRLSDFQEAIESDFKQHQVPTRTFRDNVHNRTESLLIEVKQELQYLENLIHYCEEFLIIQKKQNTIASELNLKKVLHTLITLIKIMTSKRIKQEQIKVTLPSDLHSQLVTKSIDVLGEVNLSQYLRMLIRRDLKQ